MSDTAGTPGIRVEDVSMRFEGRSGTINALDRIELTVHEGEFLVIVGPSGCGKTTLLRILAGLEEATSGRVTFDVPGGDRPLRSMVFQEQGVFPWMTVLDNAAYALRARHVAKRDADAVAGEYLRKLGLAHFTNAYPHELSGGMRQRVNLARAFANDSAVLLMDEPLSALDEQTKLLVQRDLLRLWEDTHKTVVYITHSLTEALTLGDRVAVMTHRPGKIKTTVEVDFGRPRDVLELPNDPRFPVLRSLVWEALRNEVLSAAADEDRASA